MEKAKILIFLTPGARELFSLMNFPTIPDEARYIAFLEDGNACFVSDFELGGPYTLGKFTFLNYYTDVMVVE